jgi:tetratricopeptide (TPR) repeat protein
MSTALITSFVGRKTELALLETALASAVAGSPQVILVGGEAGIGKTRLITEFSNRVEDQARVLTGRCYELSAGGLPYGPAIEMLRMLVRNLDQAERQELLAPVEAELGRLLPTGERLSWPGDDVAGSVQAQFLELVLRCIGRIGRRWPIVLVVDDLHWADQSTLDLLVFLVHNLDSERVLVVGTYRSEELYGRPLHTVLPLLERSPLARLIELAGFGREELVAQLHGILGAAPSEQLTEQIFARSEGNAFFTEELLTAGMGTSGAQLPRRLRDVILRRFEDLSDDAQEVLRLIAVAGRKVSHRIVAVASEQQTHVLRQALREAVALQFVVADGDDRTYSFRHELAREAVYGAMLPGERFYFHGALARTLSENAQWGGPEAITTAAELAHHWEAADEPAEALAASVAAGRLAAKIRAFAEAHRQLERAVALWPRVPDAATRAGMTREQLLEQAADCAVWSGHVDRALALVREALARVDPARQPVQAGVFQERLGHYLWRGGDNEGALAALEEATALFASEGASVERARVQAEHAKLLMIYGRYSEARTLAEATIAMARAIGARRVEGHAQNTLGPCLMMLGAADAGITALVEARTIAEEVENFEDIIRAYSNLAWALENAGRLQEAADELLAGLAMARALDLDLSAGAVLLINAINLLFMTGRWSEEEDLLRRAARLDASARFGPYVALSQAELALARDQVDVAETHLARARLAAGRLLEPQFLAPLHTSLAEVAIRRGDPELASATVDEGLGRLAGSEDEQLEVWLCAMGIRAAADDAEAAGRAGAVARLDAARSRGAVLLGHARQGVQRLADRGAVLPEATAMLAVCEAEGTRLEGRSDARRWAAAARAWDQLGEPYRAADARWRQAQALLLRGLAAKAAAVLRPAHGVAVRLGAERLRRDLELLASEHGIPMAPLDGEGR